MPAPGLSLVGFLDQPSALKHLRESCVPADPSDAALIPVHQAARINLGAAIVGAGQPDIQDIPPPHDQYIRQLLQQPWMRAPLADPTWQGVEFKLIEIDKLLAYQFIVYTDHAGDHCAGLPNPPQLQDMLPICLPMIPKAEDFKGWLGPNGQSAIIKARSLNVLPVLQGFLPPGNLVGIAVGGPHPFVHVVRHNGRCYLHNGFHRAYGLRMAGVTHIPCILRDVPDHAAVGIKTDGTTFSAQLLESNDPPTLGHFSQGRATAVSLRLMSRIIHVGWSQYVIPDE